MFFPSRKSSSLVRMKYPFSLDSRVTVSLEERKTKLLPISSENPFRYIYFPRY